MFAILALFSSIQEAHAGGVGLYTQVGMHQGFAYYYDVYGKQGIDSQFLPHYGVGFEGILGARDDRLKGIFRLAWNQDPALQNPDVSTEDYVFPDENAKGSRDDGLVAIGLQWGLLGNPSDFELIATTIVSSGFWTKDSLEYFVVDIGAGATYNIGDSIQLFGVASFAPRYRKQFYLGGQATLGARVIFD